MRIGVVSFLHAKFLGFVVHFSNESIVAVLFLLDFG